MALDLTSFVNWIFNGDEKSQNCFLSKCLINNIKGDVSNVRNIECLDSIDIDNIKKHYKKKTEASISELKSDIKKAYITKKFCSKYIDWYIIKPVGKNGIESYRTYFAVYLPLMETIDDVKNYIVDKRLPCFNSDYILVTDMTDGKEKDIFIGGLNEPEPCCSSQSKEHDWDWNVYREDGKEVVFSECKLCGIKKTMIVGDKRNFRWNENHGWRYYH